MTQQDFIKEIAKYVQKYAPEFNIQVCSPIIAQACLESAYGTSKKATFHNYFGLKYRNNRITCNKGYFEDGGSEQKTDGTYTLLPSSTAWYAFENLEKGVLGYFQFINIPNYANLKGVTDPYKYLENIKSDGYATSINYVKNVYNVIQKWNLTKYDKIEEDKKDSPISYKIAIDAGHGSNTAGKRTPDGYKEHWINVKTAYYCEQFLKQHNIKTVRIAWNDTDATDDIDISLSTRQTLIKNAKCDYSISMHANAHGDGKTFNSAQGVSTHIHSNSAYRADSQKMANAIQAELIKGTPQKDRKVVLQDLAMCNCIKMGTKASCLVEIAFMTNEKEAKLMKTEEFCKEQGEDIAKGILKYLNIPIKNISNSIIASSEKTTTTAISQQTSSKKYIIQVTANSLNIRKGPGTNYAITGCIKDKGKYTIVEENNGFGKLKSGAGWISLKYTKKV